MAGIYIHIPFCRQACSYCNFHFSTTHNLKTKLLEALNQEIELTKKTGPSSEIIDTIYFGGGTPSLLSVIELTELLHTVRASFTINLDAEVTLEANPDDINPAMLQDLLSIGINRLSLGVQSFNEAELRRILLPS